LQDEVLKDVVTDHAVIRYLQRFYDLDLNVLREEIIGNKLQIIHHVQTGNVQSGEMIMVCDKGKVVTVKPVKR